MVDVTSFLPGLSRLQAGRGRPVLTAARLSRRADAGLARARSKVGWIGPKLRVREGPRAPARLCTGWPRSFRFA